MLLSSSTIALLCAVMLAEAATPATNQTSSSSVVFNDTTLIVAYHLGPGGQIMPLDSGNIVPSGQLPILGGLSQGLASATGIVLNTFTYFNNTYTSQAVVVVQGDVTDWAPQLVLVGSNLYMAFKTLSS